MFKSSNPFDSQDLVEVRKYSKYCVFSLAVLPREQMLHFRGVNCELHERRLIPRRKMCPSLSRRVEQWVILLLKFVQLYFFAFLTVILNSKKINISA